MSRVVATLATAIVVRTAAAAAAWWAISEGDPATAAYALAIVPAAVAASLALSRPRPRRWTSPVARARAAAVLAGWFLWRSVLGAIDVSRRAIARPPDLDPEIVHHRFTIDSERARTLIALLLSLMPGSLPTRIDDDVLHVHVLHRRMPVLRQVERLEELVARVIDASAG